MAGVWDKLDAYTKSDYLNSSDEENGKFQELINQSNNNTTISNEVPNTVVQTVEYAECSDEEDIDVETSGDLHQSLLSEMRESKLHCDTESRNVQEKINEISSEKKNQKEELSEMHHKAQVISKSARMSATEVLSTITNSETMNIEDNSQMGEYLNKIRSVQTESDASSEQPVQDDPESSKSSSSDIDLPDIPPVSIAVLNTGVMKSRVNVARQGSMKARRKPTHRKSWTPLIDPLTSAEKTEESNIWVLPQSGDNSTAQRSGSCTPSDSSSEDEKQVTKPFLKSGIALPGLQDLGKIQLQRSELKRPTALTLVKSAKDAKEHEVTKEDKVQLSAPKPDWMKEVAKRKRNTSATRRKHVTLPGRCSELDKLFEQRKNVSEGMDTPPQITQDDGEIAKEAPRPNSQHTATIDPQLSKLLEKRRKLKPMEDVATTEPPPPRPKSLHLGDNRPSELDKMFGKRVRPIDTSTAESATGVPFPRPRTANMGVVHARVHDGQQGKLDPLPGHVKVAKIGEVVNQVVQFTPRDGNGGSRAMLGRIPASGGNQATNSQAGHVGKLSHVGEFAHGGGKDGDGTGRVPSPGVNQATNSQSGHVGKLSHVGQFAQGGGKDGDSAGRVPSPAGNQRPPSRLGYNDDQPVVVAKYEEHTRDNHVTRTKHGDSYSSPSNREMVVQNAGHSTNPRSTFSPQGNVGYSGERSNRVVHNATHRTEQDVQGSQQSTSSDLPKWKQELREKKRLQAERQSKTSHDKENIKTESSPEDGVAEWQQRLQGIRKKWSEDKDKNDNINGIKTPLDNDSDDSNEKELPGFLKEFKEKKMKQKMKVTVTAKSSSDKEKTSVEEEGHKSSSKHELGTLV